MELRCDRGPPQTPRTLSFTSGGKRTERVRAESRSLSCEPPANSSWARRNPSRRAASATSSPRGHGGRTSAEGVRVGARFLMLSGLFKEVEQHDVHKVPPRLQPLSSPLSGCQLWRGPRPVHCGMLEDQQHHGAFRSLSGASGTF